MNFHQTTQSSETGREGGFRYSAAQGAAHPLRNSQVERLFVRASAPILGSRLLFPRRFDRVFEALSTAPDAAIVPPEHALRYYGARLHLEVRPRRLKRRISDWVEDERGVRWIGASFLDAAIWDDAIAPVHHSPIHREMQELVAAGSDFRDTRAYRGMRRAVEHGRAMKRNDVPLSTVEAVDAYFGYCRDLIESIRTRGVSRHQESRAFPRLQLKHLNARSPFRDSAERDIGVAVTNSGDLIRHLAGKHRTAIAQALDLPTIPVEIRMVHTEWLSRQVARTGLSPHQALAEGVRQIVEGGGEEPGLSKKRDQGFGAADRQPKRGRRKRP